MSLKYITSEKYPDGCRRVRGCLRLRGHHNFISLGVQKGHNPDLVYAYHPPVFSVERSQLRRYYQDDVLTAPLISELMKREKYIQFDQLVQWGTKRTIAWIRSGNQWCVIRNTTYVSIKATTEKRIQHHRRLAHFKQHFSRSVIIYKGQ